MSVERTYACVQEISSYEFGGVRFLPTRIGSFEGTVVLRTNFRANPRCHLIVPSNDPRASFDLEMKHYSEAYECVWAGDQHSFKDRAASTHLGGREPN